MTYLHQDEYGPKNKMGLNNTICENPAYWCRSKKVWLSEEDAKNKRCLAKPTFDMIGTKRYPSLVEAKMTGMYHRIYNTDNATVSEEEPT